MRASTSKRNRDPKQWAMAIAGVAAIGLGIAWYLPSHRVELNQQDYDITLALYRVCNQRSEPGLEKIEAISASTAAEDANQSESGKSVHAIIEQAKAGQWKEATMACRKLLDDQVHH